MLLLYASFRSDEIGSLNGLKKYEATNYISESASAWQQNCDGELQLSLFQELSPPERACCNVGCVQSVQRFNDTAVTRQTSTFPSGIYLLQLVN
jgi:hypothetical protein